MITVIGSKGVVGSATYELFKHLGYDVVGCDKGDDIPVNDMYFICVPEAFVEDVVKICPKGLIVVRSSVTPKTCETLSVRYNRHISHNPEFLHQAIAKIDAHTPDSIVIGQCCQEHGDKIESLYKILQRPIARTIPRVSEMVKLARNNYGALIISFWNEMSRICQQADINPYHVGMIASLDPIISEKGSRYHGKYGGACLPKDIDQMIWFAYTQGVSPILLEAVKKVNDATS